MLSHTNITRSWLVPTDSRRNYFYLSRYLGQLCDGNPANASVVLRKDGVGPDVTCTAGFGDQLVTNGALADYWMRCKVPDGTTPGVYTLRVAGDDTDWTAVRVRAARTPGTVVEFGPVSAWASSLAQAFADGVRDVRLKAGPYRLVGDLTVPLGATITADEGVVYELAGGRFALPVGASTDHGVTFVGGIFRAADPIATSGVLSLAGAAPDVVFDGCVFRDVSVRGASTVTRCRFERSSLLAYGTDAPQFLLEHSAFEGASRVQSAAATLNLWPNGGAGSVSNRFSATGRGLYFNTTPGAGAVRRMLSAHPLFDRLNQGGNAGEAHMAEGPGPFDHSLTVWPMMTDCPNSAWVAWHCPVDGATIIHLKCNRSAQGIVLQNGGESAGVVQRGVRALFCDIAAYNPVIFGAFAANQAAVNPVTFPDPDPAELTLFRCTLNSDAGIGYPVQPTHSPPGNLIRVDGGWTEFEFDPETGEVTAEQ